MAKLIPTNFIDEALSLNFDSEDNYYFLLMVVDFLNFLLVAFLENFSMFSRKHSELNFTAFACTKIYFHWSFLSSNAQIAFSPFELRRKEQIKEFHLLDFSETNFNLLTPTFPSL